MGIFDDLSHKLQAKAGEGAESSKMAAHALKLIEGLDDGLDGLVRKFDQAGLKEHAQSWIGKGRNLPLTAAQVKAALGPELEKLAQEGKMTVDAAATKFAAILPEVVDKLTPDGIAPKVADLKQSVSGLLARLKGKDSAA